MTRDTMQTADARRDDDHGGFDPARIADPRFVAYLGEISYGIFLFHMVVLTGFYALIDRPVFTGELWSTAAVGFVGGTVLAALSYRLLERPLMARWRDLVPNRAARTPAGTGSTAAATAATASAPST